jgi:hypothetical protein
MGRAVTSCQCPLRRSIIPHGLPSYVQIVKGARSLAHRRSAYHGHERWILDGSGILAQAGPGNRGVDLRGAATFVQDSQSIVSATSASGNNGTLTINAPQTDFSSASAVPEVSIARAPELTDSVCQRRGGRSTLVREGRGGVAPGPDGYQAIPPPSWTASAPAAPPSPPASSTSTQAPRVLAAPAEVGCE